MKPSGSSAISATATAPPTMRALGDRGRQRPTAQCRDGARSLLLDPGDGPADHRSITLTRPQSPSAKLPHTVAHTPRRRGYVPASEPSCASQQARLDHQVGDLLAVELGGLDLWSVKIGQWYQLGVRCDTLPDRIVERDAGPK